MSAKTKVRKGPLKKLKTVLAHRSTGGYMHPHFVIYQAEKGELVSCQSLLIERDIIHEMGNPDVVTITVEPGDTIKKKQ